MTITIQLNPEEEAILAQRASELGESPDTAAANILRNSLLNSDLQAGTMADVFKGRTGRVAGSSEAFSEQTGKRFAEYVVKKHQEGKL